MTSRSGTFEYVETKIRREAHGTSFGHDFEWLCKWYLENAPLYRGKFRKVWRWDEWPDRWGRDCGIDLIAETTDSELWAIQCKAVSPEHTVTKAEIDSFLSESNRKQIAYRLLIATTDNIGPNALRTIENQARHASVVLRGDLVTAELDWPSKIGGSAPKPPRWKPLPHQQAAIKDAVAGFKKHDRGRLIMACGTGKTLTGLWINEALGSRRTLLLVPSISLAQQNLKEWGRHAKEDFDCLVVCSDETVASDRDDPALRYVADLGIKPTTDPGEIAAFLAKRRSRPTLVISTYQSCERVSRGQSKAKKWFDLAICDEAHRLVGHAESQFATVLHDKKIRARRRLFMTATPRYFTQRAKERGAEQEIELVSMDDETKFGPEFHVLNFHDAITAKPEPLLTDYQVVVIGVTSAEAKAWVADAKLVRTRDGFETDARTLAAQIGLAKAVKQYDLTRMITFHRSIRRASRFVDGERRDSLPAVIEKMRPSNRPSGRLWARHVSGETAASKRASLLKELGDLPRGTRGLISNCACLGEGVDVPALDGVAFIDPKGSVVDIIQAVGRVIRKSPNKKIGTIIIPVFVDESEDADHALENSAFDPVWQVLKALRAHDRRLADELDQLRTSLGKQARGGKRIKLPANILLDVPKLLLGDFEQAFYVRAVKATTEKPALSIEQILQWADEWKARTGGWPNATSGAIPNTEETWAGVAHALTRGHRGMYVHRCTLSQLLHDYRGVRNRRGLGVLTEMQILEWADRHFEHHGSWPTQFSGDIPGTYDSWAGIRVALRNGARGLPRRISLADLLWEKRGVPNKANRPKLFIQQILRWCDEHKIRTGAWPDQSSGKVHGTAETWGAIQQALAGGKRGLPGGSSIRLLLYEHRGVPHPSHQPRLSVPQILRWADEWYRTTGRWPKNSKSVITIPGTQDSWASIDGALRAGRRGLRRSSLAELLEKHRGIRNHLNAPPFTIKQILRWADRHKRKTGEWPTAESGPIVGVKHEKWANVQAALSLGTRGLPGADSLARLLERERGVRNRLNTPKLTSSQVLAWADAHFDEYGEWPTVSDRRDPAPGENWNAINAALERGSRGLPGDDSLAKLLAKKRGVRRGLHTRRLTVEMITEWAKAHHSRTGKWPTLSSGLVHGTNERWNNLDQLLAKGLRGLRGGQRLASILAERCGVRNHLSVPDLSVKQILIWVDQHYERNGSLPTKNSGEVFGTEENWSKINTSLKVGNRGLPGGSSLAKLLDTHRRSKQ
jgi:superfamily II DNA or RNA helicase